MAQSRLGKDAILVPIGTTAERPSSPQTGEIRFNTDLDALEAYDGVIWEEVGDQTITAGSGLTGGGTGDVTLNHDNTSSQSSVSNSGNTVIQGITLDGFGHVTDIDSTTITAGPPVGATFIQFPGRSDPATLFGGTWSTIFDNEGVFFRTPGGGASSFGGGIQTDQMQRLTGKILLDHHQGASMVTNSRDGVFTAQSNTSNRNTFFQGGSNPRRIAFNSGNSPGARVSSSTSGETRVKNRTIRVWLRTA